MFPLPQPLSTSQPPWASLRRTLVLAVERGTGVGAHTHGCRGQSGRRAPAARRLRPLSPGVGEWREREKGGAATPENAFVCPKTAVFGFSTTSPVSRFPVFWRWLEAHTHLLPHHAPPPSLPPQPPHYRPADPHPAAQQQEDRPATPRPPAPGRSVPVPTRPPPHARAGPHDRPHRHRHLGLGQPVPVPGTVCLRLCVQR